MPSKFIQFKNLHASDRLLVLPNAWDAKSAVLFQEKGFPAIATSSAAVASSLGYGDGEQMSFADYLFVIRRILASIQKPLSVDIEMGYGRSNEDIYANIRQLTDLGVVGINIEDSVIRDGMRTLKDARTFAETIWFIKNKMESDGRQLFINIRCDTFILDVDNRLQETVHRLKFYNTSGADGIFLPCISQDEDIAEVFRNTILPINVMAIPGVPGFGKLRELGVRRVSMGPFLFEKTYDNVNKLLDRINTDNNFSSILS